MFFFYLGTECFTNNRGSKETIKNKNINIKPKQQFCLMEAFGGHLEYSKVGKVCSILRFGKLRMKT